MNPGYWGDRQPVCKCGKVHDPAERFWVTVKDYETRTPSEPTGRTGWLAGPFDSHEKALKLVDPAKALAMEANSRAVFYAYGTVGVIGGLDIAGIFNAQLGVTT